VKLIPSPKEHRQPEGVQEPCWRFKRSASESEGSTPMWSPCKASGLHKGVTEDKRGIALSRPNYMKLTNMDDWGTANIVHPRPGHPSL